MSQYEFELLQLLVGIGLSLIFAYLGVYIQKSKKGLIFVKSLIAGYIGAEKTDEALRLLLLIGNEKAKLYVAKFNKQNGTHFETIQDIIAHFIMINSNGKLTFEQARELVETAENILKSNLK